MIATARLGIAAFVLAASVSLGTVLPDGGPAPSFLKNVEGTLYFATYETGGWRLWKSDGTDAGTISLVSGLGLDVELVAVDTTLVFSTRGKLWKTDGTPAGTTVVAELPFYPNGIKSAKNGVVFSDGRGQLWKSDLTAAGTVLVKDIPPGYVFHDLTPAAITTVLGKVFFRAVDQTYGNELWVSNGTPDGTTVLDVNPFGGSAPGSMMYFEGTLLFSADGGTNGYELWRSDGTPDGTVEVKDIHPAGDAFPLNLRAVGDIAFFSADDGTGAELWKTDGTTDGTVRVADINPSGGSFPNALVNVGGTLYFRADDGTSGVELWKSDGTPEGTVRVADLNPTGSSVPAALHQVNGRLFFTADDGTHGEELWTSDGTSDGTVMVADVNPAGSAQPHYLVVVGERLSFAADDGTNGTQLWTLDCAAGGWPCTPRRIALPDSPRSSHGVPFLVKDVNPGPADGDPYYLASVGDRLFFRAFRPDTGNELWTSDGTEDGTRLVRDLNAGPGDSHPYGFTDVSGTAFFLAESPSLGSGLWKSDGTEAGTTLVHDADSGYGRSSFQELTAFKGFLYYFAWSTAGTGLWRTDGTLGGTEFVLPAVWMGEIEPVGDVLFFVAPEPGFGRPALWRSDGTGAGSQLIRPLSRDGVTGQLVAAGPLLFFRSNAQLWRSDGTPDGTINLPAASPKYITAVGDDVFFSADTFIENEWLGRELWRSDGTPEGTALAADVNSGPDDSLPGRLTNVNGTLFFWATDGNTGFELWKSDGTAHGTLLVRDIDPTDVTVPSYFQAVGDFLYFTAHNPSFGYELWRSDGTHDGTMIVRNINLVRSSYPESPANVGGTLFFYADDGRFGDELWAVTPCGDGTTNPGEECDDGNLIPRDGCSELCRIERLERCDNCQDDDGDGLVDLEDPQCCIPTGALAIDRLNVGRHDGRRAFKLTGGVTGIDVGTPKPLAHDVALQLHVVDGPAYCARIPADLFRAGGKTLRFDVPKATVASARGMSRLTIRRRKNGTLRMTAAGRQLALDAESSTVRVVVGLGANAAASCAGTMTRTGRGSR